MMTPEAYATHLETLAKFKRAWAEHDDDQSASGHRLIADACEAGAKALRQQAEMERALTQAAREIRRLEKALSEPQETA